MELSDKEWEVIEPLMQEPPSGKPGRPWRGNREVLDAILWVLRTGAPLAGFTRKVSPLSNLSSSFSAMVIGWNT